MKHPATVEDLLICTLGIMAMQLYFAWSLYCELSKKINELRNALKGQVKP